jgi:K+-sensing histidine kinase KdpD
MLSQHFFFFNFSFLSEQEMFVFPLYIIPLKHLTLQVQAETLVIEKNNVPNGIVELINQHHITKLVMGMSSFSTYADTQLLTYYNEAAS